MDGAGRGVDVWGGGVPRRATWEGRRAEVLEAFSTSVYGRTPEGGAVGALTLLEERSILEGRALRSDWLVECTGPLGAIEVPLLVVRPAIEPDVPVLLGLNISGNPTIGFVPGAYLGRSWMPVAWPLRQLVERGYAVATIHHDTIEADHPDAGQFGVRSLFESARALAGPGAPSRWGTLGAWAWGLSRALDAIARMPGLDERSVVVHGHSRLGKAALWAAAQDQRFAAVVSSQSGRGGAALNANRHGETIAAITAAFPHWFAPAFAGFAARERMPPVDQHELLALVAPRPVHVASASEDANADPRGEFLSVLHASPVFAAYGASTPWDGGDVVDEAAARAVPMPELDRRVGGTLSYHLRYGAHGVLAEDWRRYLEFADDVLGLR